MRIAIDSGLLVSGHRVRGIGVHTRELIEELKKLGTKKIKVDAFDFSKNTQRLTTYDVVHYPYFHPFFITLPFDKPAKKVVLTIHDLIPLIYPKQYPAGLKGTIRFWIQKFLLRKVDGVITISETSKKDICRFLGVHPDKVQVVYLAPRTIFKKMEITKRYGLPERFVLYVGDVNYNKNIPTLIRACKLAKIPLVICGKQALEIEELGQGLEILQGPADYIRYVFGKPHPELAHFKDLLREFTENKKIIRLGFVPDSDLVAIYNLATIYCQPSIYEGFGLPLLEAFACGTPVVASKTQALVEIGEGGALFADPKSPEDFADKIRNVLEDKELRDQLINTGKAVVKNFSWEKTARETLGVYKQIYENSQRL